MLPELPPSPERIALRTVQAILQESPIVAGFVKTWILMDATAEGQVIDPAFDNPSRDMMPAVRVWWIGGAFHRKSTRNITGKCVVGFMVWLPTTDQGVALDLWHQFRLALEPLDETRQAVHYRLRTQIPGYVVHNDSSGFTDFRSQGMAVDAIRGQGQFEFTMDFPV